MTWYALVAGVSAVLACTILPIPPTPTSVPTEVVATVAPTGGANPVAGSAEVRAREEAAKALGLPLDQIAVERVEAVQWRDSSLGCAEPGKLYAQVIVPGQRIVLVAAGQRVEVHSDSAGRQMIVCRNPTQ